MAESPETMSEAEAMHELAKQMWERYFKQRAIDELLNHSLDGYKATVVTNNGDGTLTVHRPFDNITMTLRCPPALAEEAQPGKQVLVVQLGDASNSFILCGTDLSGFGGGGGSGGESVDMLGNIAQLTADSLSTSGRIRKYFLQDTSDDTFLRIQGDEIQYVVGSVVSQTPVQAQDRYGRPLYWEEQPAGHLSDGSPVDIAGDRIYSTFIVTDWPVYTYTYSDTVQATYVRSTRTVNGNPLSSDVTLTAADVGAQSEITASGILKGDGQGGVTAATAGTDYATPAQLVGKANQSQLATVESGSTASRAYAVGEYFCLAGLLYRVTAAISSGDSFTPGTNCKQVYATSMSVQYVDVSGTSGGSSAVDVTGATGLRPSNALILSVYDKNATVNAALSLVFYPSGDRYGASLVNKAGVNQATTAFSLRIMYVSI